MAMSLEEFAHREWLGYVQPVGLVVSVPALLAAQCYVNKNIGRDQQRLIDLLPKDKDGTVKPEIADFPLFAREVLNWDQADLVSFGERHQELEVALPQYRETLQPTYFVPVDEKSQPDNADQKKSIASILVKTIPLQQSFDDTLETDSHHHWQASPQSKFERLLRETNVPIGILTNGAHIRLIYAPRGESSGFMTFSVAEMASVAGRPIFAAMHCLLSVERLFLVAANQRLPAILSESRKYQNTVSTQLAEQVMSALFELLRGLQAANDQSHGELLRGVLAEDPNEVYKGLLTVLMRLVFVLYAEDRGLVSDDPVYVNHYSLTGLFDRLRSDAGRYPDTMEQRYGAWAQLLTLFRMIFSGAKHNTFSIPARSGYLFDPDRYAFLEGEDNQIPRIPDGVIFRVLSNLLILDGERLSYRALDVEQIGSVYETIMGFNIEVSSGKSIAIKPIKSHGAPSTINLESVLESKPADRVKLLKELTDQSLTGQALDKLKSAKSVEDLLDALDRKIAKNVTPNIVPSGAMIFQPSDERRKSGSHYTPRALTEPIVRTTLRPVLEQLGENPIPADLLKLKLCDPAMGSGAFLVEACRQVADQVVAAWSSHQSRPHIPPDEDEILHARRLVAQRCLYGVDKNPMAVDLAKLSLWLATLAKDHPFTFLDHALRCGDSLVGLTADQIAAFHWSPPITKKGRDSGITFKSNVQTDMDRALSLRRSIIEAGDDMLPGMKKVKLDLADEALSRARLLGDACVGVFFSEQSSKKRDERRDDVFLPVKEWVGSRYDIAKREPIAKLANSIRLGNNSIEPFHWEIEFPEVFQQLSVGGSRMSEKSKPTTDIRQLTYGFDCIVGNPPFAGRSTLSIGNQEGYIDWLKELHPESHGNSDLVAHFFRRSFNLISSYGTFGLIATNTIGQGDTRHTGLRWICSNDGTIYEARRRMRWPGLAAVVVSVVHVSRRSSFSKLILDDRPVSKITAYLFHAGSNENPSGLIGNKAKSFQGCVVVGNGFTFDENQSNLVSNPLTLMFDLVKKNPRNAECIFPYIGGEELNASPTQSHRRYIINFGERDEHSCRSTWPDLMQIVEEKVRPERIASGSNGGADRKKRAEFWWRFSRTAKELYHAISDKEQVLVTCLHSNEISFAFINARTVFSHALAVFPHSTHSEFAILQSRIHEIWARCFGSSMKDDLRYTPSDCYETFPFPEIILTTDPTNDFEQLATIGVAYYSHRATLMVEHNEGLTKTYNRFHDPFERSPKIIKLRELHAEMDRAVLAAYGWTELAATAKCEFLLDYEDEEDVQETSRRKKPWRYRWPDDFRDEVLASLLELNAERAKEEALAGKQNKKTPDRKIAAKPNLPMLPGLE